MGKVVAFSGKQMGFPASRRNSWDTVQLLLLLLLLPLLGTRRRAEKGMDERRHIFADGLSWEGSRDSV